MRKDGWILQDENGVEVAEHTSIKRDNGETWVVTGFTPPRFTNQSGYVHLAITLPDGKTWSHRYYCTVLNYRIVDEQTGEYFGKPQE